MKESATEQSENEALDGGTLIPCSANLTCNAADPELRIRSFSERFLENLLYFQIIYLQDSYVLWAGDIPPKMESLYVALPLKFVRCFEDTSNQFASSLL
mmetsp:Transcript_827/g.1450  ORF Transcript_827/g.1450 Transcript_827/m.1450 type:complete len:99 (-) Transcript_827:736-1032(-)